jgi:hypothetical protein
MIRGSKQYVVNRSGTGTITHLAPEALRAGSRLTTAVDAYSFGVLMYEVRRPRGGVLWGGRGVLMYEVRRGEG